MSAANKKRKTTRAKLHHHVHEALEAWRKAHKVTSTSLMTDAIEYLARWWDQERPEGWHPEDTRHFGKQVVTNLDEETRELAQLYADAAGVPITIWVSNALRMYADHVGVQYEVPQAESVVMLVHELGDPNYMLRVKLSQGLHASMAQAISSRIYDSHAELLIDAFAWHLKQRERRTNYRYITPPLDDAEGISLHMPPSMHDSIMEVSEVAHVNKRTIIHNMLVDFIEDHLTPAD